MNKLIYRMLIFLFTFTFSLNCSQEDLFNNLSGSPDAGNSGEIEGDYDRGVLTLNWTKATDDYTDQSELMYMVVSSKSDNINTVRSCERNGTIVLDWTADIDTADITGVDQGSDYFNVLVRDEGNNKTAYNGVYVLNEYPVPGNSGFILVESAGDIITLTWTEASDPTTPSSELVYTVFQSTSGNIGNAEDARTNGTQLMEEGLPGITTYDLNLTTDGVYYFNVLVMDSDGNEAAYAMTSMDMEPPVPGNNGAITLTMSRQSALLTWSAAEDTVTRQSDLQYKVFISGSNNINTVESAESNGAVIVDWTPALTAATVNGLNEHPRYYFNVIVRDTAGNKAAYAMECVVLAYCVSSSGSNTGGDGSAAYPFLTIQHGINRCDADNISCVWVEIGTYDESNIDLDPDGDSSAVSMYGSFAGGFAGGFAGRSMDAVNRSKIRASSGSVINVKVSVGQDAYIDGFIICGRCLSSGVNGINNYGSPVIQNNIISAGASPDSIASVYGIYNSGGNDTVIRNNVICGGYGYGNSLGIYVSGSDGIVIYNNSINGGSGQATSYAVYCLSSSTPRINNNIIFTGNLVSGYGIYEADAESDPVEVRNNCFFDCPSGAYYDFDSSTSITSAQISSASDAVTDFSGNIFFDLIQYGCFVDPDDYDGGGLALNADAPDSVSYGGLDGQARGWGFNNDITWGSRSGNGITGWSMGAYERQ